MKRILILRSPAAGATGSSPDDVAFTPEDWSALRVKQAPQRRVALGRASFGDDQGLVAAAPFRPVLVLGPQRSRKTTGVVIPTLLEWRGPAVVTSVRTDVLHATLRRRGGQGRTFVYEPTGRLVTGPAVVGWNPLRDCREWDGALQTARWLTEAGAKSLREGEFWHGLAAQLLAPLLFAAATNGYEMGDVVRWVKLQEEFEVRSLLQASGYEPATQAFEGMVSLESRIVSSVYGTLMSILSVYDYQAVLDSARGGFDASEFFDGEANTLYLCAPPDVQAELAPLFTALLRRILREAYEREARGQQNLCLLVLLDEAGNIAPLDNLDTLATTAAGTGIQLVSVFHDMAQMIGLYGASRAQSIANNHSGLLLLPGNRDPMTVDLVGSLLGSDQVPGVPSNERTALRRMAPGTALCVYEHLEPRVLRMRSSSHDSDLLRFAESGRADPRDFIRPNVTAVRDAPDGTAARQRGHGHDADGNAADLELYRGR